MVRLLGCYAVCVVDVRVGSERVLDDEALAKLVADIAL